MTEAAGVYIGLDLGTSGLKGIALDASGAVAARGSSGYPTSRPADHAAEQAPRDWITAIGKVAAQLAVHAAPDSWRAIGLSAMIPTLVTAGADGEPIGPAITWQDSRAETQADQLRERCGPDALYRITGQWVDGRYLLPMFLRLTETEPVRAAATSFLLGAKDYLFGTLTGQVATDPSTASGFGCYRLETGRWDSDVLAAEWRLPALPPILPASTTRPLRSEVAAWLGCRAIPVCLGAADSVLGALGLGVSSPGQIAYVAGTSTVILGVTNRLLFDPMHRFLITPLAAPGNWGLEMDLLATGSAIRWLADLLGGSLAEADLVALAAGVDPADAPVVLPFVSPGEQGALWDPQLHGTIAGLRFGHGRPHLARGLINGILLESRRCLAVLDQAGSFGRELMAGGGSAAESAFRADLADATGRRVVQPGGRQADYSAIGAALLAARSVGHPLARPGSGGAGDVRRARGSTAGDSAGGPAAQLVSEPDAGRAASWRELWDSYERARHAITRYYHGGG